MKTSFSGYTGSLAVRHCMLCAGLVLITPYFNVRTAELITWVLLYTLHFKSNPKYIIHHFMLISENTLDTVELDAYLL